MNSTSINVASSVARRLRRPSSSLSSSATRAASSLSIIMGSSSVPVMSSSSTTVNITTTTTNTTRRSFGSGGGTRGARGHGWWVNYRAGKGGRHLQGTYSHLDLESMAEWNDAVFQMGSQMAYLDVKVEALAGAIDIDNGVNNDGDDDDDDGKTKTQVHRLKLELATAAMPRATDNVMKLIQAAQAQVEDGTTTTTSSDAQEDNNDGYLSSTLHRIEKGVGILGGLVSKNPNAHPNAAKTTKTMIGRCHSDYRIATSPTAMDISSERLVLSHLPGVITMLQPRIGEIDSRFMVLSHHAPHMDGVSVAVGRLVEDESLEAIQKWESSLITSYGVPTNVILRIVGCGLLEDGNVEKQADSDASNSSSSTEKKQISSME